MHSTTNFYGIFTTDCNYSATTSNTNEWTIDSYYTFVNKLASCPTTSWTSSSFDVPVAPMSDPYYEELKAEMIAQAAFICCFD